MDKHQQHQEQQIEKSESSEKLLSERLMQEINILGSVALSGLR